MMERLCANQLCTGCTACAAACPKNCIEMLADVNGFLHPFVDEENCVDCGQCEKACPILQPQEAAEFATMACAAFSKDEDMRLSSSSGGIFTELARSVMARDGAVFGASYDERFKVVHICVENESELQALRGAKYAQSDLRGIFRQVKARLKSGQQILFFGTPCQAAGLKTYLGKDYENLLLIDCVCHSVPSPLAWEAYINYRAIRDNGGKMPIAIDLRSKKTGWSRYQYSNLFTYANGRTSTLRSHESLFMQLFINGMITREACQNCHFKGYDRSSDLTLGDFWGVWEIVPEMDDNKGTSVVLIHSERGKAVLKELSDKLTIKEVALEEASRYNPAMLFSSKADSKREEAFSLIRTGSIAECEAWFTSPKPSIWRSIKKLAKRALEKLGFR